MKHISCLTSVDEHSHDCIRWQTFVDGLVHLLFLHMDAQVDLTVNSAHCAGTAALTAQRHSVINSTIGKLFKIDDPTMQRLWAEHVALLRKSFTSTMDSNDMQIRTSLAVAKTIQNDARYVVLGTHVRVCLQSSLACVWPAVITCERCHRSKSGASRAARAPRLLLQCWLLH